MVRYFRHFWFQETQGRIDTLRNKLLQAHTEEMDSRRRQAELIEDIEYNMNRLDHAQRTLYKLFGKGNPDPKNERELEKILERLEKNVKVRLPPVFEFI